MKFKGPIEVRAGFPPLKMNWMAAGRLANLPESLFGLTKLGFTRLSFEINHHQPADADGNAENVDK
jgi:hypothetical protein